MNLTLAGMLISMIASTALAQDTQQASTSSQSDTATLPQFDVVSVSEVRGSDTGKRPGSNWTPNGYFAENMPLKRLVCFAYGIPWDRVNGGPSWIEKTGFDIKAKVSDADVAALNALNQRQRNELLKPLLANRFHLQVHTATNVVPAYELVVAKDGPKINASAPGENATEAPPKGRMLVSTTQIDGHGIMISNLANALRSALACIIHERIASGVLLGTRLPKAATAA